MGGRLAHAPAKVENPLSSCVKVFFLRHGKAEWPGWSKPDNERPLTKEGEKEVGAVAKFLSRLEIAPLIVSSPLPRARQTATITAEILGTEMRVAEELMPGFDSSKLAKLVEDFAGYSLMLVGHEPDFSRTIAQLTGGSVKMAQAGVALVELDSAGMTGKLLWLLPPKIALLQFSS